LFTVISTTLVLAVGLTAKGRGLASGTWGGDHAVLEVTEKGGEIEFECASGRLDDPIAPDDDGHFDVAGTFTPQHAGPVRDDDVEVEAVHYQGQIEGNTMTLEVVRKDDSRAPYTLARDRRTNLKKCR
jgi:hypothetical protein